MWPHVKGKSRTRAGRTDDRHLPVWVTFDRSMETAAVLPWILLALNTIRSLGGARLRF
jgi:hypothetical protein